MGKSLKSATAFALADIQTSLNITTNLVLAAGLASRWDGLNLKQLLPFDGLPLIVRTCRQLEDPIIVTVHDQLTKFGFSVLPPRDFSGTCRTVISTRRLWRDRVNIWLGDVYYTKACVEAVLGCKSPVMFFGDGRDIFAVSFSAKRRFSMALKKASKLGENECRLWEAYRALYGLDEWPLTGDSTDRYTMIRDETADFDTFEKYKSWLLGRAVSGRYDQNP
jgi:hypothetical protein